MIQTYTYTQASTHAYAHARTHSVSKHNILIAVEMQLIGDVLEAV